MMLMNNAAALQSMAYSVLWTVSFFLRNMAVLGALLLLLAETTESARVMFAGVPTMQVPANGLLSLSLSHTHTHKHTHNHILFQVTNTGDYLQVAGRILIIFMLLSLFKFDNLFRVVFEFLGLGLGAAGVPFFLLS